MRRAVAAWLLALTLWSSLSPPLALAAESGWLRLLVHQPGLIDMDGEEFLDLTGRNGRRPVPWTSFTVSVMAVAAGEHRLELRPADVTAVPPWETIDVSVAAGETLTVRLGAPLILTSPSGARILIDGEEIGAAPVRINPTRLPGRKLLVELPGYQRRTLEGDSLLDLARVAGGARLELEPLTEGKAGVLTMPRPTGWIGRHETLALVGSATLLAGGVAAGIHFKNRADDYYEQYQRTGNQDEQERLFDRAQQNDRLSLIGWGVGELAFFATFFLLIHESKRPLVPNPTAPIDEVAGNGSGGSGRTLAGLAPMAPDGTPGVTLRISHGF
ncbi:MAG: PEGA domain-containing protein [Candidatus Eisenbacteria bacterium]|nr:PEGA domain-containing protein [Candidatus Eisenbacteria bacterium]